MTLPTARRRNSAMQTTAVLLFLAPREASAWMSSRSSTFPCSSSSTSLFANTHQEWSVADDWEELSSENPRNSAPDSKDIFNQNIGVNAAHSIRPDDNVIESMDDWSPEDQWVHDIIDQFQNPISSSPLYDVPSSSSRERGGGGGVVTTSSKHFEEQMGDEIAMLVRCNESPEDMLVRAGRAVPEPMEEQKMDAAQLVYWTDDKSNPSKGFWTATPFFLSAVQTVFDMHAEPGVQRVASSFDQDADEGEIIEQEAAMDARAVARWMTQSLGTELETYNERRSKSGKDMTTAAAAPFVQKKTIKIGPHDSRILKVMSKYGTYGTGKLTLENFQQLYVDALTHMDNGMKLQGSVDTLHLRNPDHIRQVWRDLHNHGIVSPNERAYNEAHAELQAKYGSLQQQTKQLLERDMLFMDECEILDYTYEPPPTEKQIAEGYDVKNNKYIRKSSHEGVALAPDKKTPLYLEEGSFVFIDEESCIGCMQCVNVAPDSFLMMESGRARTFQQRNGPDVNQGVAACPVTCMHKVSYDELKELETARDKGDGRTDHQHMGHQRGYTPLHVARRGSDNNHRSSWYHYMKGKCCSSGQCPQRGCFDCPSYRNPGENPYFQKRAKEAQHTRAQYFTDSGAVDLWRKAVEL